MSPSVPSHIPTTSVDRWTGTSCGELPTRGIQLGALGPVLAWDLEAGHVDYLQARVCAPGVTVDTSTPGRLSISADSAIWLKALEQIRALLGEDRPARADRLVGSDEAAQILGISRDTLDRLRELAPPDLPGAPVPVGTGTKRRHLRWEVDRLKEWFRVANSSIKRSAPNAPASPMRKPPKNPHRSRPTGSKRKTKRSAEGGKSRRGRSLLAQVKSSQER